MNHQELRNSLYSGPLNELLIELAGGRLFDEAWGIPPYEDHYRKSEGFVSPALAANKLFQRMKDCEIVLRFLAFRESGRIKGSVRTILDGYMKDNRDAPPPLIKALRDAFLSTLRVACNVFGEFTFRIPKSKGKWVHSQPLFDAVMVATEKLVDRSKRLISNKDRIQQSLSDAMAEEEVKEIIVGKPNTAGAIRKRISIVYDIMKQSS